MEEQRKDRMGGMLAGVAIGDALGAPTEFYSIRNNPYTGKIEFSCRVFMRSGWKELSVGQYTDDTEIACASVLARYDHYYYEINYKEWWL